MNTINIIKLVCVLVACISCVPCNSYGFTWHQMNNIIRVQSLTERSVKWLDSHTEHNKHYMPVLKAYIHNCSWIVKHSGTDWCRELHINKVYVFKAYEHNITQEEVQTYDIYNIRPLLSNIVL